MNGEDKIEVSASGHTVSLPVLYNLFRGCAPEREQELDLLWKKYSPKLKLVTHARRGQLVTIMAVDGESIVINYQAIRFYWMVGFLAWEGLRSFLASHENSDHVIRKRFEEWWDQVQAIVYSDNPAEEPLPEGVPELSVDSKLPGSELAIIAVGWVLLHEFKHIQDQASMAAIPENSDRSLLHQEELSCDSYATRYLLDDISAYCDVSKEPLEDVKKKRVGGIYFALFGLVILQRDAWGDSETHPAVQRRIDAVSALAGSINPVFKKGIRGTFRILKEFLPGCPQPWSDEEFRKFSDEEAYKHIREWGRKLLSR